MTDEEVKRFKEWRKSQPKFVVKSTTAGIRIWDQLNFDFVKEDGEFLLYTCIYKASSKCALLNKNAG